MAQQRSLTAEEQAALEQWRRMKDSHKQLHMKIVELDSDRKEHELVVNTLKEMEAERKCYRLVNGVLLEQTVKEVLPTVSRNREGIDALVQRLGENASKLETEIETYEKKHKIIVQGTPEAEKLQREMQDQQDADIIAAQKAAKDGPSGNSSSNGAPTGVLV